MFFATPIKPANVTSCLSCKKSPKGHLRPVRNIVIQNIYTDFLKLLEISISQDQIKFVYFCDACIATVQKFKQMKENCHNNLPKIIEIDRCKRVILHSGSPIAKRISVKQTPKFRGKKQLFCSPPCTPSSYSVCHQNVTDHEYSSTSIKKNVSDIHRAHHPLTFSTAYNVNESMVDDITAIKTAASRLNLSIESTLSEFVSLLLKAKPVHDKIWQSILFEINNELDQLCSTKRKSILRSAVSELSSSFLESIIFEMEERCPRVLCMLVTLCTPVHLQLEDCFTTAALYAMAMHSRNPQMIAFQKMVGAVCVRYNCGNGLLNALGSLDICIPEKGKLPMLDEIAKQNGKGVTKALRDGKTIKVTVDNIDGRIFANQVRVGSGNRDYHYTHWTVLVDRALPIDLTNLNLQQKVIPLQGPDVKLFFCNNTEFTQLRSYYTWLIERILVEEVPALSAIKIPKLLEGRYKDIVDRPSEVHPMFVSIAFLLQQ